MNVKRIVCIVALCGIWPSVSGAVEISRFAQLDGLIERLVTEHQFSRSELQALFTKVELRPKVVEAMKRPSERLPWHRYRKLFVTKDKIDKGIEFWSAHKTTLTRAEQVYGVPQSILVAILGVETRYGRNKGRHPVIESLTTLTLQYPRRSKFFGKELEEFLLLSREEKFDPLAIKGSYAGAMGIPQFMPSSYRGYAVDFDDNGVRDLIDGTSDAIGSVGNYLRRYRWQTGDPVAVPAKVGDRKASKLVRKKLRPNSTVAALRAAGVEMGADYPADAKVGLLRLDGERGSEYRVAFHNFYVITRYNPSKHYAMAVFDLAEALTVGRRATASREAECVLRSTEPDADEC